MFGVDVVGGVVVGGACVDRVVGGVAAMFVALLLASLTSPQLQPQKHKQQQQ